jgi:site-specific DNA-methyltransferase (adenine-specific)
MLKLLHGDCLELMKDIPDKSIDAIITDPPYGTTACKWDAAIPFEPMWKELNRIIKDNGAIVLFGSQPFTSALVMSNPKMFKYELIWDKISGKDFYQAKKRPLKQHENIMIFYKNFATYNPQMTNANKKNIRNRIKNYTKPQSNTIYGNIKKYVSNKNELKRYPGSIFVHSYQANELHYSKRLHQTQKPILLIEYLVKTYTNENDTVLDFTMGSGTTGVACKNLNRNFIGIEKDDNYFKIASDRIHNNLVEQKQESML